MCEDVDNEVIIIITFSAAICNFQSSFMAIVLFS